LSNSTPPNQTMARGPKKHLKRLNAPKHWMLDKMGGAWAPRPSTGPHKLRECLPVILILRNRLKYALNRREVTLICMEKLVQVDGKIRTDPCFPTGFMDVVTLGEASKCFDEQASIDRFRVLYDVKGRFKLIKIKPSDAKFKLLKVRKRMVTTKKVPCIVTHDGRTIRYPDPLIKVSDTIKYNIKTGKITSFAKLEVGSCCIVTKGRNCGRIGTLINKERHPGSFDIAHIKDKSGVTFCTRLANCFRIGSSSTNSDGKIEFKYMLDMGFLQGIKTTIIQDAEKKFGKFVKPTDIKMVE